MVKTPENTPSSDQTLATEQTPLSEAFVRKARHDLRSPLTVIKGAAELLRTASDRSNQQLFEKSLERIERAIEEMQIIIDRTFPYDPPATADEYERSNPATIEDQKPLDLNRRRILLAEDKDINRQVISELLEGYNCSVTSAVNGAEAIREFGRNRYDLILMDIEMPEVDGIAAARAIREKINGRSVPIIALSAHEESFFQEQCIRAGMNGYLSKPINPDKLRSVLRKWLGKRSRQEPIPAEKKQRSPDKNDLLDTRDGLERVAGNINLYERLLARFIEEHADTKEQIWSRLDHDDTTEAIRIVHNLKSISGNLGLKALSSQSANLEGLLQNKRAEAVIPAIDLLSEVLNDSMCSIRTYLSAASPKSKDLAVSERIPLDDEQLTHIRDLLDDDISQAVELTRELKNHNWGTEINSCFDKLATAMHRFEVESAKGLIEEIIKLGKQR